MESKDFIATSAYIKITKTSLALLIVVRTNLKGKRVVTTDGTLIMLISPVAPVIVIN
jgi:hypothetical protein